MVVALACATVGMGWVVLSTVLIRRIFLFVVVVVVVVV
jgi:hypothetical protein